MRSIIIGKNEDGQRLDRVLIKLFPNAGKGFLFKMLRKKNITLNGKKAEGSERLNDGDEIKVFFSEETFTFMSNSKNCIARNTADDFDKWIVYEDEDVIILNKPKGILSQKAVETDRSLNEMLIDYMLSKGEITEEQLATFKPSICNRLDRNTEGLICGGKTLAGLRGLSEMLRSRKLSKYYFCIVKGNVEKEKLIMGYLVKDEKTNKVSVLPDVIGKKEMEASRIATRYKPVKQGNGCTLLEVELITGKSHQIRAHLASTGHPIAGDMKYGDVEFNRFVRDRFKVKDQLLIAYRLVFPKDCGELKALNGREFVLEMPEKFQSMLS